MKQALLLLLVSLSALSAAAAPPVPANSVTVELGAGNEAKVTRRKGDTSKTVYITINAQDKVTILKPTTMHGGLHVDTSTLPTFAAGTAEFRVRPTAEIAPASAEGVFRTVCDTVGFSFNDSIVYPNEPGRAHGHTFLGNTEGIRSDSTVESIRTSGNSACRGGIANRSAYWFDTLIDIRTNKPVFPSAATNVYYKNGKFTTNGNPATWSPPTVFTSLPVGLRMIAGDPTAIGPPPATLPDGQSSFAHRWSCLGQADPMYGSSIPNCAVGSTLVKEIFFPQCWDGKNLDAPDHKSHMSYTVDVRNQGDPRGWSHGECPPSHPKVVPAISYQVHFKITEKDSPLSWRGVCDVYPVTKPGGYCSHGDWRNGWDEGISEAWTQHCIRAMKDCHSHLLGDGREIF